MAFKHNKLLSVFIGFCFVNQECQKKLEHKLGLDSYLLKPVQRITKYQLLLKVCSCAVCTVRVFISDREDSLCSPLSLFFCRSCWSTVKAAMAAMTYRKRSPPSWGSWKLLTTPCTSSPSQDTRSEKWHSLNDPERYAAVVGLGVFFLIGSVEKGSFLGFVFISNQNAHKRTSHGADLKAQIKCHVMCAWIQERMRANDSCLNESCRSIFNYRALKC